MHYIAAASASEYINTDFFQKHPSVTPAHTGFLVKSDGHLYSESGNSSISGGMMLISFECQPRVRSYDRLLSETVFVFRKKGFSGIIIDGPDGIDISQYLVRMFKGLTKNLIVSSGIPSPSGCVKAVSSAVSGGTLRQMLLDSIRAYGLKNICIAAELIRADFTLPAMDGKCSYMTLDETMSLIKRYKTPSFYSHDLETNYFSYKRDGKAHMVLYDNSESMIRKITLASSLGITKCLISYSDTKHIIGNIIR